jgi:hypothetical protein
LSFHW